MVESSNKIKDMSNNMDIPLEIVIKPSQIDPERQGLWCKQLIKEGTKFGPFIGEKAYEVDDNMDPAFIWEIVDIETKEFLFYINATNPRHGNWMRFINCARFLEEQNIVSGQEGIDIYFQAIKDINPGEELLTWYEKSPVRRKKGKRKSFPSFKQAKTSGKGVRQADLVSKSELYTDANYVSQRGRKRSVKKYWEMEAVENAEDIQDELQNGSEEEQSVEVSDTDWEMKGSKSSEKLESTPTVAESNAGYFQFEIQSAQTRKNRLGRKIFECDICAGIYRHGFSLKRHYIRSHINLKYISKLDMVNCSVPVENDSDGVKGASTKLNGSDESSQGSNDENVVESTEKGVPAEIKNENDMKPVKENSEVKNVGNKAAEVPTQINPKVEAVSKNGKVPMPGLYRCNICEQFFDMKEELKEHIHNHPSDSTEKQFSCEHCNMKFKHRQNLMRHEVVHSGAKPYTCNQCDKKFPTTTNQKRHEHIHKGQKFTCTQCSGTFTQTGDLKKHMSKQHPETYHECAYCSKYFPLESTLEAHLQKDHTKDLTANKHRISVRKKARKVMLEKDRAESRKIATDQSDGTVKYDPALQYGCIVCRKRFHDYANMCRHRRLAHDREPASQNMPWLKFDEGLFNDGDDLSDTDSQLNEEKPDALQTYFAKVSSNISNNLLNFLEGKEDQLTRASTHIRWKQKNGTDKLPSDDKTSAGEIRLEDFNFPQGFRMRTISELFKVEIPAEPLAEGIAEPCLKSSELYEKDSKTASPVGADVNESEAGMVPLCVNGFFPCNDCQLLFHDQRLMEEHMTLSHDVSRAARTIAVDESVQDYSKTATTCSDNNGQILHLSKSCSNNDEEPLDLSKSINEPTAVENATMVGGGDVATTGSLDSATSGAMALPAAPKDVAISKPNRKLICLVCHSEFFYRAELVDHQEKQHSNVDYRHVEVDSNFKATWSVRPNPVGILNVSCSQLPADLVKQTESSTSNFSCTKCRNNFTSRAALHQHISECGDYWRSLNERVTWVFVLRGSEVPVDKSSKKRGKFQWNDSPEESSRRRLQKMLLQQHLGENVAETASVGRRSNRTGSRQRSIESVDDVHDPRRNKRRCVQPSNYNSSRNGRRKETPLDLTDLQKCLGCGEEFKTIVKLERHIPVCVEKQRLIELHADKKENDENSAEEDEYDPSKHMCIYCERQFMYLRILKKHVSEVCPVRKDYIEKGEYIDKEWEEEIAAKVQSFMETVATPEETDERKGKRKKRGNNWGYKTKTKKSFRSSDDGDSLFGWEESFMSTWVKQEGEQGKNGGRLGVASKPGKDNRPSASSMEQLLTGNVNIKEPGEGNKTEKVAPAVGAKVEQNSLEDNKAEVDGRSSDIIEQVDPNLNSDSKDEASDENEMELEFDEEEPQSAKPRKRRGSRLTMRSRRKKPTGNDKQSAKSGGPRKKSIE